MYIIFLITLCWSFLQFHTGFTIYQCFKSRPNRIILFFPSSIQTSKRFFIYYYPIAYYYFIQDEKSNKVVNSINSSSRIEISFALVEPFRASTLQRRLRNRPFIGLTLRWTEVTHRACMSTSMPKNLKAAERLRWKLEYFARPVMPHSFKCCFWYYKKNRDADCSFCRIYRGFWQYYRHFNPSIKAHMVFFPYLLKYDRAGWSHEVFNYRRWWQKIWTLSWS